MDYSKGLDRHRAVATNLVQLLKINISSSDKKFINQVGISLKKCSIHIKTEYGELASYQKMRYVCH